MENIIKDMEDLKKKLKETGFNFDEVAFEVYAKQFVKEEETKYEKGN